MAERTQRRLAAIVAADVAGYSRLVGTDEEGTLDALRRHRSELIDPLVAQYGGRIANTAGDSVLLEFPSVVDAVRCCMAVQQGVADRNIDVDEDRRIRFRVGINLGDVVAAGADLLGDGVNVAARLEALSEPGGIALSDDAYRQVRDRLDVGWRDGGQHEVKNIARPIQVWHWTEPTSPSTAAAPSDAGAAPPRNRPSIAVLPFDNMSGDAEQETFSDGIAEDVITELSRFRELMVIARNSTFTYKGQAVNVSQIGRELGVDYVVEGSMRKAANRIRVTAQLIDAKTGSHLWAQRYDRDLTDIFAVQDEITRSIVSAIAPGVLAAEDASARRKAPENLSAWECVVRGASHMWAVTHADFEAATALFDQAIALDPNYVPAHGYKALLKVWNVGQGWSERATDELAQATAAANRALALDANDAMAYYAMGLVHAIGRRPEPALDGFRTAIELNPNFALAHFGLGLALTYAGAVDEALAALDTARQLNPRGSFEALRIAYEALAHHLAGRDEEAVRLAARSIEMRQDSIVPHLVRSTALGHLGRIEEARAAAATVMQIFPTFYLAKHERFVPIAGAEDRARYIDGLRKAGLPE